MPSATAFGRRWSALVFALTQTVILAAVACSSGAATAPEAPLAAANDVAVPIKVGSSVGEHIPDFELRLSDGARLSSAALLADRQPTFLFFFATW